MGFQATFLLLFVSIGFINGHAVPDLRQNGDDGDIDQIVGGSKVPRGQHRYMAKLKIHRSVWNNSKGGWDNIISGCGATVLDNWNILTAGHCVYNENNTLADRIDVYMRVYTIDPMDSSYVMRTVQQDGMRVHPNFDGKNGNFVKGYDIAILHLSDSVDLDQEDKNAICAVGLPTKGSTETYDGAAATAVGWGRTATNGSVSPSMLQATINIQSRKECTENWGTVFDYENQVCTFDPTGKSACSGDSGGPLIAAGVQVGIASYVKGNNCSLGTVFTRVSPFINDGWIGNNMYSSINPTTPDSIPTDETTGPNEIDTTIDPISPIDPTTPDHHCNPTDETTTDPNEIDPITLDPNEWWEMFTHVTRK